LADLPLLEYAWYNKGSLLGRPLFTDQGKPMPARQQHTHTEDWSAVRQLCLWKEQVTYERIRPVVLFGDVAAERAQQTGTAVRTLRRHAVAFDHTGMSSLFRTPSVSASEDHRALPPPLRQLIVDIHTQHPALSLRQIEQICFVQYNRRPSHQTIKAVLANGPAPTTRERWYPVYEDISDGFQRRKAVVQLHAQGWSPSAIASYMQAGRSTIYDILRRWKAEELAGLPDKSRANTRPVRKVDLAIKQKVLKLQENPALGAFRIQAALKRMGIHLSQSTCGRILAENRQLYGWENPTKEPEDPREHPFKAAYRHHIWSVDARYIEQHQIPDIKGPFYIISILDNFSRAILASEVVQKQDMTAYLIVLYAAIRQHGSPRVLVSDSGAIFLAKQAQRVYVALDIEKRQIAKKQAWQNLIETQFNLQRRLADYFFERATTWEEAKAIHERWMNDHNYQDHWAHRNRDDGKTSPAQVLGWVRGQIYDEQRVHRVFFSRQFQRAIGQFGYIRFRHWRMYAEESLAGKEATIWLYGETLTLEFLNSPLAQYTVKFQPDKKHIAAIPQAQRFQTSYPSPQSYLWDLSEVEWHLVKRLPEPRARRKSDPHPMLVQPPLFPFEA
jgi:putative transposase